MKARVSFIGCVALLSAVLVVSGQTAARQQQSTAATVTTAAAEKALLDQYCVTCHSDKARNAGGVMSEAARKLSFDKLDVTRVHDNADAWEKIAVPVAGVARNRFQRRDDWRRDALPPLDAGPVEHGSIAPVLSQQPHGRRIVANELRKV